MKSELLSLLFIQKLILSPRSGALIRRITILSFIAIVISLTSFFIVLFVMNGMNLNIKKRIMALEPHLTTFQKPADDQMVKEMLGEGDIIYFQNFDLILRTIDGQFRGAQATGYDEDGLKTWMTHLHKMKGLQESNKFQSSAYDDDFNTLNLQANEVALGADLARSLGLLEGDEITLIPPETLLLSSLETPLFQKVTVRRIITTDLYDLDSKLVMFNLNKTLLSFSKTLSLKRGYHAWLSSVGRADSIKKDLAAKNILSETWQEKNSDLFFALLMEKTMIGVFLGLAGLIASSSILTVLALLLSQKKRDIAIIKTLGLSQEKTLWLFTKMGLWISCSAIVLGTVIGLSVSYYLQYNPVHLLPNIYYDSSLPALVDLSFVFGVLLISLLLAFLGSYLPARATLRIQPAILLRQKN
ncbi:MAG: ABC transporter permease [Bdellovibrio sp.]|nr:ABC transporter permease [Bdellovibrio sp.]